MAPGSGDSLLLGTDAHMRFAFALNRTRDRAARHDEPYL